MIAHGSAPKSRTPADHATNLIIELAARAASPATVLLRVPLGDGNVDQLLAAPGITSVVLPNQDEAFARRHPGRIGWFDAHGTPTLPEHLADEIMFVGSPWELGFLALLRLGRSGVRRCRFSADSRQPFHKRRIHAALIGTFFRSAFSAITQPWPAILELLHRIRFRPLQRGLASRNRSPLECVRGRVLLAVGGLGPGGSERQIVNTLTQLAGRGTHDLVLLHEMPMRPPHDFHLPQLRSLPIEVSQVIPFSLWQLQPHNLDADIGQLAGLVNPDTEVGSRILAYVMEFNKRRPEIVHTWLDSVNVAASVAAAICGVRGIVMSCRSLSPRNFALYQPYMRPLYRVLASLPNVVFLNNSRAGALDYESWLGLDSGRTTVLCNGFDFSSLSRTETLVGTARAFRQKHGIPVNARVVGTAMRFTEEKRPMLWLETAAEVHRQNAEVRFLVVGDGPMRQEFVDGIARLGLSGAVALAGYQKEVATAIAAMDIYLLTSRAEGLPNVLIEAQALGVPVVATRVGGAPETFADGLTGFAVQEGSAPALAKVILRLLESSALLETARTEAPRFVRERFAVEEMVTRLLGIYEVLALRRQGAH
jgi:glycosyltransferase involved in cell wall biosynthesis